MSETIESTGSPGRTPARAPAFSLPPEWEGITRSFRQHMVDTASRETAKTYNRHVRAFLKFCFDQKWALAEIPPEGVFAYVEATQPKAAYHNLMTSALVSFRRWANAQGLVLAPFSIPATMRTAAGRRSKKQREAAKAAKEAAAVVEAPPGPSARNAFVPAAGPVRNDPSVYHPPTPRPSADAIPFASPFPAPPQYANTFDEAPIVEDETGLIDGVPSPAASPNLLAGVSITPGDAVAFGDLTERVTDDEIGDDDDGEIEAEFEYEDGADPNELPNTNDDHPDGHTEATTEQETEDMSAAPTVPPTIAVVPNPAPTPSPAPVAPAATPNPVTIEPQPIAAPVAAPTQAIPPTPPTPVFNPVPEPAAGRVGAPMATQKITAKREVANRNPLGSTMPANQRLRVTKLSDGSGPIPAGSSVLIGIYPSADVMRQGDPILFLNNVIRPAYGPRPGEPDAQYYIEYVNEWNQVVGAPCSVPIAAPLPGATAPGIAPAQSFGQSNAQRQSQDDLIRDLVTRSATEQKEHYNQMLTMLTNTMGKGGTDPAMLMMMMQNMKSPTIDVEGIVRAVKHATGGGGSGGGMPPSMPSNFTPLPLSALGGLGDDGGGMADITKTLVESLVKQQTAPQQDGFEKMLMMAKLMKEITGGGSDVMMRMMEDRNRRLEDELRDLKNKPTNNNLTETINSILAVQNLSEKLGGGNSRGSLAEMFLENFGEIGDGVAKVLKSMAVLKAPTAVAPPAAVPEAKKEEKKTEKKVVHTLPLEAQNALLSMRDAKVTGDIQKDDQVILNAVFALVSALGSYEGAGNTTEEKEASKAFWGQRGMLILNALRQITSRTELRGVVTNTFMACGATEIMTDPLVDRITDVLAKNYTSIYRMITQDETADKILKDAPPPGAVSGAGSTETSTKDVMNGSGGEQKVETPPSPKPEGDEEEDEEDGDFYCDEDPPKGKKGYVCNKDLHHKGPHSWILEEEDDDEDEDSDDEEEETEEDA